MMASRGDRFGWRSVVAVTLAVGAIAVPNPPAQGQLIPVADGTLSTTVGSQELYQGIPINRITGGTQVGANLFHSFQSFTVDVGRGVYFDPAATGTGITNILSRVTGNSPSQIDGRLGVIGAANLYLLNPNGIIFGATASLDVQGSFFASTASAIPLGTGQFSANPDPAASTLIAVDPRAFFLNALGGTTPITNQATLQAGGELALKGSDVTNTGTLSAGQNLLLNSTGAIANSGLLQAGQALTVTAPSFDNQITGTIQSNQILNSTTNTFTNSGIIQSNQIQTLTTDSFTNSGTVQVNQVQALTVNTFDNTGNFQVTGDLNLTATSAITNSGNLQTQNLTLTASSLDNSGILQSTGNADITTSGALNNSGTVNATQSLTVTTGSLTNVQTGLISSGQDLNLSASSVLTNVGILQATGNLTLDASTVNSSGQLLAPNGTLFVNASGDASILTLNGQTAILFAKNNLNLIGSQLTTTGNLIVVANQTLSLQDGPATPFNASVGGDLRLSAGKSLDINILSHPSSATSSSGNLDLFSGGTASINGRFTSTGAISVLATNGLAMVGSTFTTPSTLTLTSVTGDVQLSDNAGFPLILAAAGDLTLRTPQRITIQTTNPGSVLQTAGNLSVFSDGAVSTNIRLAVAGGFSIQSGGDITLGQDYTGAFLNLVTANGAIATQNIRTLTPTGATLRASRGIRTGTLNTSSTSGVGGQVNLLTTGNNLTIGNIDTSSTVANGGEVNLAVPKGAIATGTINTRSTAVNSGNGGSVTLAADSTIRTNLINASAINGSGGQVNLTTPEDLSIGTITTTTNGTGNGGGVALSGRNITPQGILTEAQGMGSGGDVRLNATGSITTGVPIRTSSAASTSGDVVLQATGDIRTGTVDTSSGTGTGGTIRLTSAAGAIHTATGNVVSYTAQSGGSGGTIALVAPGTITVGNLQSYGGRKGAGGDISVISDRGGIAVIPNSTINSSTFGSGNAGYILLHALNNRPLTTTHSQIVAAAQSGATGSGGTLTLWGGSVVLDQTLLDTGTQGSGNSGQIDLASPEIVLQNGTILSSNTGGAGRGGSVAIAALNDGTVQIRNSAVKSLVLQRASGNGGDIAITGGTVTLGDRAMIDTSTNGLGNSGSITVTATNSSTLSLTDASSIQSDTLVAGSGGSIQLNAESVFLTNSSLITARTLGTGNGSNISVNTTQLSLTNNSQISTAVDAPNATGQGGQIGITAGSVQALNGGQLSSSTMGQGNAGDIRIRATQSAIASGNAETGFFATSKGTGSAGNLTLNTPDFQLLNEAQATVSSSGTGNAGKLEVSANSILLDTGSRLSADTASGKGGAIQLFANGRLTIQNNAEISTSTTRNGDAGQITAVAKSLFLIEGGKITSHSTAPSNPAWLPGSAGSITLRVSDRLRVNRGEISASSEGGGGGNINISAKDILLTNSSLISSSVMNGIGDGGSINIRASQIFFAFEDSDILANAQSGGGGNILLDAPVFIADLFATVGRNPGKDFSRFRGNGRVDISASSAFGGSGSVQIPDTSFIQNSLSLLDSTFVNAEQIVAGSCLARRNAEQGSLVVTGTGGLARNPYAQMPGRYTVVGVQPIRNPESMAPDSDSDRKLKHSSTPVQPSASPYLSWQPGDPIQEARGFMTTPDGHVVMGTAPQLAAIAKAQDLICNFANQQ